MLLSAAVIGLLFFAAEEAFFCPVFRHFLLAFGAHQTQFADGCAGLAEEF